MRAKLEIATISGLQPDDHMGFPLSVWHRTVYVPLPEVAGLEPTDIYVITGQGRWGVRRLMPFAPFELPSPHYAPVPVTHNLERVYS